MLFRYAEPAALRTLLCTPTLRPRIDYLVIDVRDDDFLVLTITSSGC